MPLSSIDLPEDFEEDEVAFLPCDAPLPLDAFDAPFDLEFDAEFLSDAEELVVELCLLIVFAMILIFLVYVFGKSEKLMPLIKNQYVTNMAIIFHM